MSSLDQNIFEFSYSSISRVNFIKHKPLISIKKNYFNMLVLKVLMLLTQARWHFFLEPFCVLSRQIFTGSSVPAFFQGSVAQMRIRKLQHSILQQDFVETMTDYNQQQMDHHNRHRDHIRKGSSDIGPIAKKDCLITISGQLPLESIFC